MSLYEALNSFVSTGVLACAGLVGCEMPPAAPLDGARFAQILIDRQEAEDYGAVLDCLANEIYLAKDQRGFPQTLCEDHAAKLASLLDKVRLEAGDLAPALQAARMALSDAGPDPAGGGSIREQVADAWISRAAAGKFLEKAGLVDDVCRFLMEMLCHYVIEQPRFLSSLKPALGAYRAALLAAEAGHGASVDASAGGVAQSGLETVQEQPPANAGSAIVSAAVAEIKSGHGITDAALRRFQSILAAQPLPAEQRIARLDEMAGWLAETVAHLSRPGNDPIELRRLKLEAANALCAGEFERAMDLLKDVRQHIRDGRRRTEARLAEEMETLKAQMTDEAAATARLGELALARFEFDQAADLFADAAANLPAGETVLEAEYRQRQAEALAARAELTGDPNALQAAASAFRAAMELVSRTADPIAWARLGVGLGDMLMALGQRSPGSTVELEQAAVTYEGVVSVIDRVAHPMRWALVQLSRAAALVELGQRTEREKNWQAAAAALVPALEVFESRGAGDLADAARAKLHVLQGAIGSADAAASLERQSKAV